MLWKNKYFRFICMWSGLKPMTHLKVSCKSHLPRQLSQEILCDLSNCYMTHLKVETWKLPVKIAVDLWLPVTCFWLANHCWSYVKACPGIEQFLLVKVDFQRWKIVQMCMPHVKVFFRKWLSRGTLRCVMGFELIKQRLIICSLL